MEGMHENALVRGTPPRNMNVRVTHIHFIIYSSIPAVSYVGTLLAIHITAYGIINKVFFIMKQFDIHQRLLL